MIGTLLMSSAVIPVTHHSFDQVARTEDQYIRSASQPIKGD